MNLAAMVPYATYFQQGVIYTVLLSLCTVFFGLLLAILLAFMRMSKLRLLRAIASIYIEFIRGTPMLVQLFLMFYLVFGSNGLTAPQFTLFGFIDGSRFVPGIIALSMNSGAYVAEIVRAGIQGVDYGQTEAARSLGMTGVQNMRYIVFPQAIRNILPAIANEFVVIIKESSVCMVLGMQDIMYSAKLVQGATFLPVEPLLVATVLYFCLTFPTSKAIQYFERRMNRGYNR